MRAQHLSRTVTYQRGDDSVEVAATVGRTVFEIDDGSGAAVQWESRDFLVPAADLVLAGEVVEPLPGDRIRETQGEKVYVYEVLAPGKEPCWRWSDPFRRTLRVHTKQVDEEDA
jgi:hypothetical protein